MSTSSLLRLEHVQKNYGKTEALSGVNLDIQPGRIVGLLGPNGSGKTTIIKLINGLLQPTSGQFLSMEKNLLLKRKRLSLIYQIQLILVII